MITLIFKLNHIFLEIVVGWSNLKAWEQPKKRKLKVEHTEQLFLRVTKNNQGDKKAIYKRIIIYPHGVVTTCFLSVSIVIRPGAH